MGSFFKGNVASKPGQLRTLLKNHVPDKTDSYVDPSELSTIISWINTGELLSETFEESTNEKIIENWKSAIDAWVDRFMTLLSDPMPEKCWVGVHLMGLTCQKCSFDRFLASYSGWFQKLYANIQEPRKSSFVKVASCASLAELLIRLDGFPEMKKDGTNLARKLIEPLLELLCEEEAILEGAVRLLFAVLISFPSAVLQHYDKIEAAVASVVLSGKGSDGLSKKLVHCLALLPKSRGDEDSWCLLMQKILLSINDHLNDAFGGLEEGSMKDEVFRLLVPYGKQPPPPLGKGDAIVRGKKSSEEMLTSSSARLMLCCCEMLKYSYSVQVNLPVRALLTLIERILIVDESMPRNLSLFVIVPQQELILSLHCSGLELLDVLIKAMQSKILPHAPCIIRLISRYFKKCTLPELRKKVYSVIRTLLMSLGIGLAIFFGQEVVDGASMDLNPENGTAGAFGNFYPNENKVALLPNVGKRKRASVSTDDKHARGGLVPKDHQTVPSDVKIAALKALEFLLIAALNSESWRSKVDKLLISVATNVMEERCLNEHSRSCLPDEPASVREELQLAALEALLASLLSQGDRPPYFAESLELFKRGRQQTRTKIAESCIRAVSSIEVLIHPRVIPLDTSSTIQEDSFERPLRKFLVNGHTSSIQQKNALSGGQQRQGFALLGSDDDELHKIHLHNGIGGDNLGKKLNHTEEPPDKAEKLHNEIPLVKIDSDKAEITLSALHVDAAGDRIAKEIMMDPLPHEDTNAGDQKSVPNERIMIPCTTNADKSAEILSAMDVSTGEVSNRDTEVRLDAHARGSEDMNLTVAKAENLSAASKSTTTLHPEEGGKLLIDSDHESSMDVFPDIVDADPDTDED